MSSISKKKFLKDSENISFNLEHRKRINFNINKYRSSVSKGRLTFDDWQYARKKVQKIRRKSLDRLEKNLIDFETNFKRNGGTVIWCNTHEDVLEGVLKILKIENATSVVKMKSMISEELELNHAIENLKIEVTETDLGEFIVQVAGEKPYHIVTPAMHKSKKDINDLFTKIFKIDNDLTAEQLTLYVRNLLREKFLKANVGISGANFLIAETGSICLTENEGNGVLSSSMPKVHIAIAGIEKIIEKFEDIGSIWPMLSTSGTGQLLTVYNSIITSCEKNSKNGPEKIYLFLLNSNRTELLADKEVKSALSCIKCGACLNECPIYRNVGGYTYGSVYSGPIGSILTPYLNGMEEYGHLAFACSLCGKCKEVCPAKIDLPELLLHIRSVYVKNGYSPFTEKIGIKGWKFAISKRKRLEIGNYKTKNKFIKLFAKNAWGPRRTTPELKKSFYQLMEERRKNI